MKHLLLVGSLAACASGTTMHGGDAGVDTSGAGGDAADCRAPDVLILLDRTMSMHRRPDGSVPPNTPAGRMETKWSIAVTALEALTAELDSTVQFGLALFPRDPAGGVCVTLSQRIAGTVATNPTCEAGQLLIAPSLGTGAAVASALDPESTPLCRSTPIGAGLGTAGAMLAMIRDPSRDQYVLFVGDGQDSCDPSLALSQTQALAAAGVHTYVVAFDGSGTGINNGLLDDMACAGRTATGFPAPCTADANGNFTATDRGGPALFLTATDGAMLTAAFESVAGQVCCGCVR